MDEYLVKYLNSGTAWILVGSGPSIQMKYPSWPALAAKSIDLLKLDTKANATSKAETALKKRDYPAVFEHVQSIVGIERLLSYLSAFMHTNEKGDIYDLIARWSAKVYLTTNYDDEIQQSLAKIGESYIPYSNSIDHMSFLNQDATNMIVKLHGDLRSPNGLILTSTQYDAISSSNEWSYWRNRILAIAQMMPLVIIGHSLTDPHISHILKEAKNGANVAQPICWIAPEVSDEERRRFLEQYRIRVTSYDNKDGTHQGLLRFLKNLDDFILPRTSVKLTNRIPSPDWIETSAPGFFVYSKLSNTYSVIDKQMAAILAAMQGIVPALSQLDSFDMRTALHLTGWPKEIPIPPTLLEKVTQGAIKQKLIVAKNQTYRVHPAAKTDNTEQHRFEQMREQFIVTTQMRIERDDSSLEKGTARQIAQDVEASLTHYFRMGGLSLATTLYASTGTDRKVTIPPSVITFIKDRAIKYDELSMRQAFWKASVDAFVHPETIQKLFLGRIAQGFFGFHTFGLFGEVAVETLNHAQSTVWLIDSNAQIPALALGASSNLSFRQTFAALRNMGIRLFTTQKLFNETFQHLRFAQRFIEDNGANSHFLPAAASGQPPYKKSNQFLEGFINWCASGNPLDWQAYLSNAIGSIEPSDADLKKALEKLGIAVVEFSAWLGFKQDDFGTCENYTQELLKLWEDRPTSRWWDTEEELRRKISPEAEAFLIVENERSGDYSMLTQEASPAWFISDTAIINLLRSKGSKRITWQTEAFIRFSATVVPQTEASAENIAFDTIVWNIAQSGINILDEEAVRSTFGGVIDQARLPLSAEAVKEMYNESLSETYGEPIESILNRVSIQDRALAAIQLANQIAQQETARANKNELEKQYVTTQLGKSENALKYYRGKFDSKRKRLKSNKKHKAKHKKKKKLD